MMIFVCILWQRVVYNDICILHLSVASVEIFAMKEVASIGEKSLEGRFFVFVISNNMSVDIDVFLYLLL